MYKFHKNYKKELGDMTVEEMETGLKEIKKNARGYVWICSEDKSCYVVCEKSELLSKDNMIIAGNYCSLVNIQKNHFLKMDNETLKKVQNIVEERKRGMGKSETAEMVENNLDSKAEEKTGTASKKNKSKAEVFLEGREKAKADLQKCGVKIGSASDVQIATAIDNPKCGLFLKAVKYRKEQQMCYQLYEKEGNESFEMEDRKYLVPTQLIEGDAIVLRTIMNMEHVYPNPEKIVLLISKIAKYHLIAPECRGCEVVSGEEVVRRLKNFFKKNLSDPRVAVFTMAGEIHVAIVKRGTEGPSTLLKKILREIAHDNNENAVKDWLYNHNFFISDGGRVCKDCQKTISSSVKNNIGAVGDKVISFNFEKSFKEAILKDMKDKSSR